MPCHSVARDVICASQVGQAVAAHIFMGGGKSGLRRVKCQVTPGGREPTESAAENIPPKQFTAGKVEMVR